MSKLSVQLRASFCTLAFLCLTPLPARADIQTQLDILESRVDDQEKLIKEQQKLINKQAQELSEQKKMIDSKLNAAAKNENRAAETPPSKVAANPPPPQPQPNAQIQPNAPSQTQASMTPPAAPPAPEEPERPQVDILADQGGVLSPKGMLTFENALEYTNTTRNLFSFDGVELAQVVLVGAITDNAVRHQIVQESGRLRLGLTNRLEADVHVPYVYRNDALTGTSTTTGIPATSSEQGYSIGDIDTGLAYQINNGEKGWPFLIGNLRYKANNADGPYDVPYNSANTATRLPTGTGFQTVEASVTAIKVSDPAVLFGNLGYVYDLPRDVDRTFSTTYVGNVNPGDAINALVGASFAINQDTSFSLGYKHSFVFSTVQHSVDLQSGTPFVTYSGSSQVGALTVGLSYAVTPTTRLNFNIDAGVTNDAPDVHLMLRIPFQLGKIF